MLGFACMYLWRQFLTNLLLWYSLLLNCNGIQLIMLLLRVTAKTIKYLLRCHLYFIHEFPYFWFNISHFTDSITATWWPVSRMRRYWTSFEDLATFKLGISTASHWGDKFIWKFDVILSILYWLRFEILRVLRVLITFKDLFDLELLIRFGIHNKRCWNKVIELHIFLFDQSNFDLTDQAQAL
jgi:hypothetical protein